MTDSINPIKFNAANIQGSNVSEGQISKNPAKEENNQVQEHVETKEVSQESLNAFANAQASYALAGIQINSAKAAPVINKAEAYLGKLSPELRAELEASIGQMMSDFEPSVVAFAKKFEEELGATFTNLPEDEQMALAAQGMLNSDEE